MHAYTPTRPDRTRSVLRSLLKSKQEAGSFQNLYALKLEAARLGGFAKQLGRSLHSRIPRLPSTMFWCFLPEFMIDAGGGWCILVASGCLSADLWSRLQVNCLNCWMLLDDKLDPLSKDPNRLKQRVEVFRFKVEDRSPDAGFHYFLWVLALYFRGRRATDTATHAQLFSR